METWEVLALMVAGAALFVLYRVADAFMRRWPRRYWIVGSTTILVAVFALLVWLGFSGFEEAAWFISLGGVASSFVADLQRLVRWLLLRRRSAAHGG